MGNLVERYLKLQNNHALDYNAVVNYHLDFNKGLNDGMHYSGLDMMEVMSDDEFHKLTLGKDVYNRLIVGRIWE